MKSTNERSPIYVILILISVILLLVFGICIYLAIHNNDFSIANYISITSSFAVALLTVIYVYASTKQMHVMKLQLDEMKTEHMLKNQPILVLSKPRFLIEVPRFFYAPPTDEFSFQSRYFFNALLINASDDPGIIINVVAKIIIERNGKEIVIHSPNERFSISSPKERAHQVSFLFNDDISCFLFEALRKDGRIKLVVSIYYQNIAGACFSTTCAYRFRLQTMRFHQTHKDKNELEEGTSEDCIYAIREWHAAISQAPAKYQEALEHLKLIVHDRLRYDEYCKQFDKVEADFNKNITQILDIECNLYEINGTFGLKTISKIEFDEATDYDAYWNQLCIKKLEEVAAQ